MVLDNLFEKIYRYVPILMILLSPATSYLMDIQIGGLLGYGSILCFLGIYCFDSFLNDDTNKNTWKDLNLLGIATTLCFISGLIVWLYTYSLLSKGVI